MDFYYHGAWRMDWGWGNPNKTAMFIVCLMLAVWLVACYWRRGFWFALLVSTALGYCLVHTYSRGGMLALFAGVAVLLTWAPRPWSRSQAVAAVAAIWIMALFIIQAKADSRYGQGLFSDDPSINSRFVVWRHFPEMLAAAPWGWGWGRSGDAYTQWYQPVDQSINYLNLLSSHFSWMVEGGWVLSLFYLAGWFAVMLLCWPGQEEAMWGVPLAVWTAFGVGGCFSQVEDSFWLWGLPLLLLGLVIRARMLWKIWPAWRSVAVGGLLSACVVVGVIGVGCVTATLPIQVQSSTVMIGHGVSKTLIYIDRGVMGKLFGHTLRRFLTGNATNLSGKTYITTETSQYQGLLDVSQIIVSGGMAQSVQIPADLQQSGQLILINPLCFPEEMRWNHSSPAKVRVYFGEYAQCASRSSWESCAGVRYLMIGGAGDFVPAWPGAIWSPAGS
jgi:hypothetical protein